MYGLLLFTFTIIPWTHASAPVCDSIRSVFQNSACCGEGGGEAFCAASETFDFHKMTTSIELVQNKTEALAKLLSDINGKVESIQQATVTRDVINNDQSPTLLAYCFPDSLLGEPSDLGIYPPSYGDASVYVDGNGNISYGNRNNFSAPHHNNFVDVVNRVGYFPPYFGLCGTAQTHVRITLQLVAGVSAVDPALGAVTQGLFEMMKDLWSTVLQFEYLSAQGAGDYGSRYIQDLFDDTPPTQWLNHRHGTPTMALYPLFIFVTNTLRDIAEGAGQMDYVGFTVVAQVSFRGHLDSVLSMSQQTEGSSSMEDDIDMVSFQNYRYPLNFEQSIFGDARDLFDYMIQVPYLRFPELTSLKTSFRCSSQGRRIIRLVSEIIGETTRVMADNTQCAGTNTTDYIKYRLDNVSTLIRRSSEMWQGVATVTLENIITAPPTLGNSYFLPGTDSEFVRAFWFGILDKVLTNVNSACSVDIDFMDPTAHTNMRYVSTSAYWRSMFFAQRRNFPPGESLTWSSVLATDCPQYAYSVPSLDFNGLPIVAFNHRKLPPMESRCTLVERVPYPYRWLAHSMPSGLPPSDEFPNGLSNTFIWDAEFQTVNALQDQDYVCEFDPTGRFAKALSYTADINTFLNINALFSTIAGNIFGYPESCAGNPIQDICYRKTCSIDARIVGNPKPGLTALTLPNGAVLDATFFFGVPSWIPIGNFITALSFGPICFEAGFGNGSAYGVDYVRGYEACAAKFNIPSPPTGPSPQAPPPPGPAVPPMPASPPAIPTALFEAFEADDLLRNGEVSYTLTVSSEYPLDAFVKEHAFDGDLSTAWATNGDGADLVFQVQFAEQVTFDKVCVRQRMMANNQSLMTGVKMSYGDLGGNRTLLLPNVIDATATANLLAYDPASPWDVQERKCYDMATFTNANPTVSTTLRLEAMNILSPTNPNTGIVELSVHGRKASTLSKEYFVCTNDQGLSEYSGHEADDTDFEGQGFDICASARVLYKRMYDDDATLACGPLQRTLAGLALLLFYEKQTYTGEPGACLADPPQVLYDAMTEGLQQLTVLSLPKADFCHYTAESMRLFTVHMDLYNSQCGTDYLIGIRNATGAIKLAPPSTNPSSEYYQAWLYHLTTCTM